MLSTKFCILYHTVHYDRPTININTYFFSTVINYLGYIWFSYAKHKIIKAPYLLGYDTVPAGKQLVVTIYQPTWQHIHKHFHFMKMTDALKKTEDETGALYFSSHVTCKIITHIHIIIY